MINAKAKTIVTNVINPVIKSADRLYLKSVRNSDLSSATKIYLGSVGNSYISCARDSYSGSARNIYPRSPKDRIVNGSVWSTVCQNVRMKVTFSMQRFYSIL